MRFTRDKHGYEHTAVVDTDRRRGRSRTRVLYWFRTPPNVKVGRAALDEDAMRLIEQLNPDVEFDWARMLKGQGQPPTEPRLPADVRRQRDGRRGQPRPQQAPVPPPPAIESPPAPAEEPSVAGTGAPEHIEAPAAEVARVEIPPEFVAPVFDDTPTPAHSKLGAEGVQRLRARYAEILRRIPERTADQVKREELRQQAERLNPDSWASDDAVVQGLEQYEAVLASLREVGGGQKRRRRRRGNRQRPAAEASAGSDASASTDDGESANGRRDEEPRDGEAEYDEPAPNSPEADEDES